VTAIVYFDNIIYMLPIFCYFTTYIFLSCKKMKNHKIMRRSIEFSFIMGNPIPTPNSMGMGIEKKSP
jgi:hypothetical protein